ncbi:MAG: hypothetical protein ACRDPY_06855 [Streptosporangiaceae bacterium]
MDWSAAQVTRVVYCTARVDATESPSSFADQDVYLKALTVVESVDHIEYGTYVARVKSAPLAMRQPNGLVLAAIAGGRATNGGIAAYIGGTSAKIAHPLNVLEDSHLVSRHPDVFRKGRSTCQIAEPLITFYQAVMRPRWAVLELGHARRVWPQARQAFLSQVVGPRFEQICRDWALLADDAFDEPAAEVGSGVVADPARRAQIEIDVAAFAATAPGDRRRMLCLGEVKWGHTMGVRDLSRLERAKDLLAERGLDTAAARLACFSGSGFDDDLREAAAERADVLLVDPSLLYA